jgi:heme-degrading monooxygenase HmoA
VAVVIRIFRVRARPGRGPELERVVRERGVPNIAKREGLVSLFLGRPDDGDERDLVLISVWRDLAALRAFKGDAWREARLLPEEVELAESTSVTHVMADVVAGGAPWP